MKTTNINPLSGFELPSRQAQIELCLKKARRVCPEIVEAFMMQHKVTGQQHSLFGMPFRFNPEDYMRVAVGFVFRDKDGTTYGTRQPTPEALKAKFDKAQDSNAADFLKHLNEMDDTRLAECFRYYERLA